MELDQNKLIEVTKYAKELYQNNKIKVNFGIKGYGLEYPDDAFEALNIEKAEFEEILVNIIISSRNIANNIPPQTAEHKLLFPIVSEFFLDPNISDLIKVRSNSNLNIFLDINTEVFTRRDKEDPHKILTFSSLISLAYADNSITNFSNRMDGQNSTINLELTKSQVDYVIEELKSISAKIESLKSRNL